MTTLFPVIRKVPAGLTDLPLPRRQPWLSRYARQCLERCAEISPGVPPEFDATALKKDSHGAPRPFQNTWWSVSHKPGYVAAVLSPYTTGIDVEQCASRPAERLLKRILTKSEADLFSSDRLTTFFRAWTAKEAILKTYGAGISKLSQCHIASVISKTRLIASLSGTERLVDQVFFDNHIAALVINPDDNVEWTILPPATDRVSMMNVQED
ncbi:MAG: 4'-phosphopantetheinyl transferase superfamily protein [Thermodesulfobacteriota bacterium]|nr:4'-phosphopantetheinyl transferase superfamily protein [Thermodesulfobacteriota bacterium]